MYAETDPGNGIPEGIFGIPGGLGYVIGNDITGDGPVQVGEVGVGIRIKLGGKILSDVDRRAGGLVDVVGGRSDIHHLFIGALILSLIHISDVELIGGGAVELLAFALDVQGIAGGGVGGEESLGGFWPGYRCWYVRRSRRRV